MRRHGDGPATTPPQVCCSSDACSWPSKGQLRNRSARETSQTTISSPSPALYMHSIWPHPLAKGTRNVGGQSLIAEAAVQVVHQAVQLALHKLRDIDVPRLWWRCPPAECACTSRLSDAEPSARLFTCMQTCIRQSKVHGTRSEAYKLHGMHQVKTSRERACL